MAAQRTPMAAALNRCLTPISRICRRIIPHHYAIPSARACMLVTITSRF